MEIVQAETLDGRLCVQLCMETLYSYTSEHATSVAHLTNFSFDFFMQFLHKAPLYLFYTMVQESKKMTKNSNQGGGVLP